MHGYTHVYDKMCKKSDDYFNYGGGSEFFGHPLEMQMLRIKIMLQRQNGKKLFCLTKSEKFHIFISEFPTYDNAMFFFTLQ